MFLLCCQGYALLEGHEHTCYPQQRTPHVRLPPRLAVTTATGSSQCSAGRTCAASLRRCAFEVSKATNKRPALPWTASSPRTCTLTTLRQNIIALSRSPSTKAVFPCAMPSFMMRSSVTRKCHQWEDTTSEFSTKSAFSVDRISWLAALVARACATNTGMFAATSAHACSAALRRTPAGTVRLLAQSDQSMLRAFRLLARKSSQQLWCNLQIASPLTDTCIVRPVSDWSRLSRHASDAFHAPCFTLAYQARKTELLNLNLHHTVPWLPRKMVEQATWYLFKLKVEPNHL